MNNVEIDLMWASEDYLEGELFHTDQVDYSGAPLSAGVKFEALALPKSWEVEIFHLDCLDNCFYPDRTVIVSDYDQVVSLVMKEGIEYRG